jgi:hypothetical protein
LNIRTLMQKNKLQNTGIQKIVVFKSMYNKINLYDRLNIMQLKDAIFMKCRSKWPRGLRRRFTAARLLRSWIRIPPGGMDVCCVGCVLSGRGLCDELITHPEESYRLSCVVECDQGISW